MSVDKAAVLTKLEEIQAKLDGIGLDLRRSHSPKTLVEAVEWEREFGPECDARYPGRSGARPRIELCRMLARQYGVSYASVKAMLQPIWAAR